MDRIGNVYDMEKMKLQDIEKAEEKSRHILRDVATKILF